MKKSRKTRIVSLGQVRRVTAAAYVTGKPEFGSTVFSWEG